MMITIVDPPKQLQGSTTGEMVDESKVYEVQEIKSNDGITSY